MDLVSLALAKKHSENIAAGVESFRVEGNTIYFTVKETQQELSVNVPTPADGVSITKVEIRKNNHLYCTLSNGKEIDAGRIELKGDGSVTIKVWDKVIEPGEDGSINLEIPGYNGLYFGEKENLSFVKYEDMGEDYWNLPQEFWNKFDNFEENFPNSYIEESLEEDSEYKLKVAPIGFETHYKDYVIEEGNTDIKIYNSKLVGEDFKGLPNGNIPTDTYWACALVFGQLNESGEWVYEKAIEFCLDGTTPDSIASGSSQEVALAIDSIDISLLYGEKHLIEEEMLPSTIRNLKNAIRIEGDNNIMLGDAYLTGDVELGNNLIYNYSTDMLGNTRLYQDNVILGGYLSGYNTFDSFATNSGRVGYQQGNTDQRTENCFAANRGEASGYDSAAFNRSSASGSDSFAIGESKVTSADGFSSGYKTNSSNYASVALGKCNANMVKGGLCNNKTGTVLAIGNGTSNYSGNNIVKSNAFSVQYDGTVAAAGTITASTTADYAENFEWFDENIKEEDRVGYFVTLEGDKIRKATPEDDYILGVVSGAPFVLGNGDCDVWNGLYMRDDYGRIIMEPTYEVIEEVDEETGETIYTENKDVITGETPKVNPNYDPELEYIPRRDRAEWAPVGMLGVLSVRQDGTLKVNGYAGVSEDGIATAAAKGYRVIEVLNNEVARIIFR